MSSALRIAAACGGRGEAALGSVFSPDEIGSLKAIAADLQRSNRSLSAVRIPGQSNTAQDMAALQNGQPSILKRLLIEGAGAIGGAATGLATATGAAFPAMAGWLGVKTVAALRDAGMKRVDDVLREAMLNPELARALLAKVPARPDAGTAEGLAAVLSRAALTGSAVGAAAPSQQPTPRPIVGPDFPQAQAQPPTQAQALAQALHAMPSAANANAAPAAPAVSPSVAAMAQALRETVRHSGTRQRMLAEQLAAGAR